MMVRGAFQGRVARGVALGMIAVGPMATAVRAAQPEPTRVELEEIVVTGTRLRMRDIEEPAPVTVFDRQKIDALGVSSVGDLLKYMPEQSFVRGEDYWGNGAQFAELRGLGADTTLVLINGRRTVPSAANITANAFDLNSIPLAAIERVEVLSDAASAVYGADAVGGVINIILKRDLTATTLDLHVGAADGGAKEARASLSGGLSGERWRASAVLDYLDRDFLLGEARDRWRNQDFTRFGGGDQRSRNSNPGNVTSRTTANLPGLPSRFAAVPAGSTGVGLTSDDFLATAGQRNLDSLLRRSSIVPEAQRATGAVFGEFDVQSQLTVFAELLFADRRSDSQFGPSGLNGSQVPATNAFNPFGVPVSANFLFTSVEPRHTKVESEMWRGVAGVRGGWGTWDWEIAALASSEDSVASLENAVNPARVAQALASSDPTQALNVFQDGPGGSPELLASLVSAPDVRRFSSEGTQVSAFTRGSLFDLPAGSVEVVLGAEARSEAVLYNALLLVDADRHATAAFAEMSIPLVSPSMTVPAVRALSLKLAGRLDDYSDFGDTFNPQYALVWSPLSDLILRASYSTSFRPPSLFELYAPRTTLPLTVTDARRNNEVIDANAITGGNPALRPIEGESFTAGFVVTPSALKGLRLSASYWQIKLDQRVSFFSQELILANEARFADRVIRAEASAADVAAGLPGPIESVDISRINFGMLETSGIDVAASFQIDSAIGQWTPMLAATWVHSYESGDEPDAPAVERVGIASVLGTVPEWRAVASLGWNRGGWSWVTTARFVSSYADAQGISSELTGRRVPSQTLLDVQAAWDANAYPSLASSWIRGLKVTVGVANVLDEEPHFAAIGDSVGYDLSQGDLRQRFGYLNLSKRF